jgi:hypothetical protein
MKLNTIFEIYDLMFAGTKYSSERKQSAIIRKTAFNKAFSKDGLIKVAFDTRRIDQETTYNPRRGLQNYNRSEQFLSTAVANKVQAFAKLAKLLDQLKLEYGKEPEWQDSYVRVLASAIHKGIRTEQVDGDYSDAQPSMASLDYLEELLYVRYRLTPENLISMSDDQLRSIILNKDELLIRKGLVSSGIVQPSDVTKFSYDQMLDKVLLAMTNNNLANKLFDVKATSDNPEVERTITITIKDKLADKINKVGNATEDDRNITVE